MTKGKNIAELIKSGDNPLYNQYGYIKTDICIFISHKDEDTEAAIELGNHIMQDFGYDIYLDIYDEELQEADRNNDIEGIVKRIKEGLRYATHLLCIISEKSKNLGGFHMK